MEAMKKRDGKLKYLLPAGITLLRLIAAPFFYLAFVNSACTTALLVVIFAGITDIADGKIARKMDAASTFGAFFDVITDFIFIVAAFAAFVSQDWYGVFVVMPIAVSFIHFLIGRGFKKPVYDPLGRYSGAVVLVIIGLTVLLPYPMLRTVLSYFLAMFFIVSIVLRIGYLGKLKSGN